MGPQVHACDPAAAKIIDDNTNIANFHGAKKYDFTAVKQAFEGCYAKMFPDYPDACGLIGGLWDGTKYYTAELNGQKFDASPCVSATASFSSSSRLRRLQGARRQARLCPSDVVRHQGVDA